MSNFIQIITFVLLSRQLFILSLLSYPTLVFLLTDLLAFRITGTVSK